MADGTPYAFSMEVVHQVIRAAPITRVPGVPAFILGVSNLRGRILPVVDLALRLHGRRTHIPDGPRPLSRIVVVQTEDITVGYLVERVIGAIYLSGDQIQRPPRTDGKKSLDFVTGVSPQPDGSVAGILDLHKMVAADRAAL